jgi:hypothetical protein
MSLLVVSAIASRSWIESIEARVPGGTSHPGDEGTARLRIDCGGVEAIFELLTALAKVEGDQGAWRYAVAYAP